MSVKPFKLSLKKFNGSDLAVLEAVYSYLPSLGLENAVRQGVTEALERHVGKDITFSMENVYEEEFQSMSAKLPEMSVVAVFGIDPLNKKAVCEIDPVVAATVVERVLGGPPTKVPVAKRLGNTELGVLEYVLLQVMANVFRLSDENPKVHFRFDKFAEGARGISGLASPSEKVVTLIFRINIGKASGFVRLALPDPFVQEYFMRDVEAGDLTFFDKDHYARKIQNFGFVNTSLWAEAGSLTISAEELAGIEVGDTVLFDKTALSLEEGKPAGTVLLRVGSGGNGGFDSNIMSIEKDSASFKISRFHEGE